MFIIFSVFYILIAAAMIVLILIQRGDGANAGSGFGGGASGTVFGARGSTSFLSRATAVLAGLFFLLSLGMAIYLHKNGNPQPTSDLGVMSGMQTPAAQTAKPAATKATEVPKAAVPSNGNSGSDVPKAATPTTPPATTATTGTDVPAAPAPAKPNDAGKPQGQPTPAKKH